MAISLLLPVVSTIQPRALEAAISSTPRRRDWRFSSVRPAGGPPSTGSSMVGDGPVGRLDGHHVEVDPERLGQGVGVGPRSLARVARRHRQPVDVLGAQGVDGHGGHQRRVDPPREADHGVGEPVLGQVVPGPEHQRLVDLGLGAEHGGQRIGGPGRAGPGRPAQVDQLEVGRPAGPGPVGRPGFGQLEVDHHQVGLELGPGRQEPAVGPDDQAGPVEDQLVLAADLVDVGDRAAGLGRPGSQHVQALGPPAPGVGRGVQVDDQGRPAPALGGHRPVGEPHVLADADTRPPPRRWRRACRDRGPA